MKILIIKHGSLGDLVLSFGAIKTLNYHYPKSELYLLTQSNYKKIFSKLPYVKQITVLSSATIYRLIAKGEFPKQIKLSERSSGWLLDEIHAWLDKKIDIRDENDEEYANG